MAKDRFKKFKVQEHLRKYKKEPLPVDLESVIEKAKHDQELANDCGMGEFHREVTTVRSKPRGRSGKVKIYTKEEIAKLSTEIS